MKLLIAPFAYALSTLGALIVVGLGSIFLAIMGRPIAGAYTGELFYGEDDPGEDVDDLPEEERYL